MTVLRVLAPEGNLASATDVGGARLVRVLNNKTSVNVVLFVEQIR